MSEEKSQGTQQGTEQVMDRMTDLGSALTRGDWGTIYTLTIVGQVEGHQLLPETAKTTKYEHVLPLLASLEQRH